MLRACRTLFERFKSQKYENRCLKVKLIYAQLHEVHGFFLLKYENWLQNQKKRGTKHETVSEDELTWSTAPKFSGSLLLSCETLGVFVILATISGWNSWTSGYRPGSAISTHTRCWCGLHLAETGRRQGPLVRNQGMTRFYQVGVSWGSLIAGFDWRWKEKVCVWTMHYARTLN